MFFCEVEQGFSCSHRKHKVTDHFILYFSFHFFGRNGNTCLFFIPQNLNRLSKGIHRVIPSLNLWHAQTVSLGPLFYSATYCLPWTPAQSSGLPVLTAPSPHMRGYATSPGNSDTHLSQSSMSLRLWKTVAKRKRCPSLSNKLDFCRSRETESFNL